MSELLNLNFFGDNRLNVEIADLQEEMTKVAGLRKECDTHDRLRSRGTMTSTLL